MKTIPVILAAAACLLAAPSSLNGQSKCQNSDIIPCLSSSLYAAGASAGEGQPQYPSEANPPEKIWAAVEQMPSFPGGDGALYSWLSSHIIYPEEAYNEGASGTVMVKFVIGNDGSVSQASIARGRHPALNQEALRLVYMLPKFIPGKQDGVPVSVWYNLPIKFKLQ